MNYLDEMTIEYFQNTQQAKNFYDTLQTMEKQGNKPWKISNNEYFGTVHATVYALEDHEEFPSLSALLVLHGEEVIDALTKKGADFAQTERLENLDFFKNFSQTHATLLDLSIIESEFALIDKGIGDVICLVKFNQVRQMNQEKLAQMIIKQYVKTHFDVDGDCEYSIKIQEPLIDFLN